MASLNKIKDTYYILYRINGKLVRKKVGKVPKSVADQMLKKFEDDIELSKTGLILPQAVSLSALFDQYMLWVSQNQASNTYELKKFSRKAFERFLLSDPRYSQVKTLQNLVQPVIEQFKVFRVGEKVSNRTINIELTFLSHCLNMAEEWGYIVPKIKIKKLAESKKLPRFLSNAEVSQLLEKANQHIKQVIYICIHTGLRIGELLNLRWENIDFENNIIHLSNSPTFKTKTRRDRIIPIHPVLKPFLEFMRTHYIEPKTDKVTARQPHQMEFLICFENGLPIKSVKKSFSMLTQKLSIKKCSLHTLRHTFATTCYMNDIDIYMIKEYLGHSRVTTTEIYTQVMDSAKHKSMNKLKFDIQPISFPSKTDKRLSA